MVVSLMDDLPSEMWGVITSAVAPCERLVLTRINKFFRNETYRQSPVPKNKGEFIAAVRNNDLISIMRLPTIRANWITSGYTKACKGNLPLMVKLLHQRAALEDKISLEISSIDACYKSGNLHLLARQPTYDSQRATALGYAFAGKQLAIAQDLLNNGNWNFLSEYTVYISRMLFRGGADVMESICPLLPRSFGIEVSRGVIGAISGGHWDLFETHYLAYCENDQLVINDALEKAFSKGNINFVNKLLVIARQDRVKVNWTRMRAPALYSGNTELIDLAFHENSKSSESPKFILRYFKLELLACASSIMLMKRLITSIDEVTSDHVECVSEQIYIVEQQGYQEVIYYLIDFLITNAHL